MEKWQENLEKAKHHFKVADHMIYVTFPLLKENRLMIKVLSEMYESVNYLITALLQYAYYFRKIPLYKDPLLNLKTFKEKIGPVYLNKSDLESTFQEDFKKYMNNTNYEILGKIPFDLKIPEAMSFAKPVVDFAPESIASLAIKEIYKHIKTILWNHS